jgi:hypothetical protein
MLCHRSNMNIHLVNINIHFANRKSACSKTVVADSQLFSSSISLQRALLRAKRSKLNRLKQECKIEWAGNEDNRSTTGFCFG